MPPRKPRSHQFIAAYPPPDAGHHDVQFWILSWLSGNPFVPDDTVSMPIKDRIRFIQWDGMELRKMTKREVALQIRWMYTATGILLDGKTETMVNALVDDIARAKVTEVENAPKLITQVEQTLMVLLAGSIIYLGGRYLWALWDDEEPGYSMASLDHFLKVGCVSLMGLLIAKWW